jgi:Zn-dependent alcohol dehydrogenase
LAIEYIDSGKIRTDRIITHRLPLERFEEGFHLVSSGEGIKVILTP